MKPEDFGTRSPGKLVPVSGVSGLTHAFVPDWLPPTWKWAVEFWPLLLAAHKSLSDLNGTGKHLPNPTILLRPLQMREAVRSSNLEGTYTDPTQQALFALDPKYPASKEDPLNAQREVFNYAQALNLRRRGREGLPLSLRLIRSLHETLLEGVRGSDLSPGQFRMVQNQIGRPARFVPPPVTHLGDALDKFERYLHDDHSFDPLVEAFLVHYQFEAIHPFMDGNGRVGRLLLAILIEEWCELSDQWLYMSAYFDANKDEYMNRLFRVSSDGDWSGWIEFCLKGVVVQAADTRRRCDQLIALHRDFHDRLKEISGSVRLAAIVDDLFQSPVVSVSSTRSRQKVTYPTARADLVKLQKAKILTEIGSASQIAYFCKPIFDISYAA